MPRHTSSTPPHPWKVTLPSDLAGTIEFLTFDRIHNRPLYSARSKLIRQLLERWLLELPPECKSIPGGGLPFIND